MGSDRHVTPDPLSVASTVVAMSKSITERMVGNRDASYHQVGNWMRNPDGNECVAVGGNGRKASVSLCVKHGL